ncbi:hypothetical protein ES705_36962 [subsurface metagenome]
MVWYLDINAHSSVFDILTIQIRTRGEFVKYYN